MLIVHRLLTAAAVLGVAWGVGIGVARYATVFEVSRTAERYVNGTRSVSEVTEPNSLILSLQHSGSVRCYGGRMTLRYEALDAQWLDRAIGWLRDNGIRPYILRMTQSINPSSKSSAP